jgi:hypothetical protein
MTILRQSIGCKLFKIKVLDAGNRGGGAFRVRRKSNPALERFLLHPFAATRATWRRGCTLTTGTVAAPHPRAAMFALLGL